MVNPTLWVSSYGDYLLSVAMMKVRSREIAEDIVQETFLSAIKSVATFRGDSTEKTWLTRILNNKVIDYYRKKDILKDTDSYLTETEEEFDHHFFESTATSDAHWTKEAAPRDWNLESVAEAEGKEFDKIMQFCIDKMPPKLSTVFMAKFIDEESSEKICKDYDITSSNFWVILHRARILMRACLETHWFLKEK
jgi:RNA polymerase sigma-70 factor (ECF subfamily)